MTDGAARGKSCRAVIFETIGPAKAEKAGIFKLTDKKAMSRARCDMETPQEALQRTQCGDAV